MSIPTLAVAVYSLGLAAAVVWLAAGLGLKLLHLLKLGGGSSLERGVYAAALGLGALAYSVLGLGLAGLLQPWAFMLLLISAALIALRELRTVTRRLRNAFAPPGFFARLGSEERVLVGMGAVVATLAMVQTLTPAWDYDGLMYHLQGPRLFLQAGRIYPVPNNWMASYPFTLEMLFTLGLGLGSESFSRLMHLTYAGLLSVAVYGGARRFAGRHTAWLAAAVWVGIPLVPIWATMAYIDLGWALYETLGLMAFLMWLRREDLRRQASAKGEDPARSQPASASWLILAGVMMGFAAGTKYMALAGLACLGLLVLVYSRPAGWRKMLANGFVFGMAALLVAGPWYLKNLAWTGNPVYPLFFSKSGDTGELYTLWMNYVNGFGAPRTWIGYLTLPITLYTQYPRFGTFLGSIDLPSLLFPLALLYPLTRRSRALDAIGLWAILRFAAWAAGTQQTRMLLPLFPALCILTASVLADLAGRLPARLKWTLPRGLGFGMAAVTLVYSLIFFIQVRPLAVIAGIETKDHFLERQLKVYPALQYIRRAIPPEGRVWLLWDGRGYYCDERCVPDVPQTQWVQVAMQSWDVQQTANALQSRGATHLLVSSEDRLFVYLHDSSDLQLRASQFLENEFLPACSRDLYVDEFYRLVELTCGQ